MPLKSCLHFFSFLCIYIYFFAAQDTEWSCDSDIVYYILTSSGGLYSDNFFAFCTALSDQYETLTLATCSWRFSGKRDCDAPKRSALCRRYCDCLRVCDACRATCLIQQSPSKDIWLIQRWSWREARLWCSCWLSAPALVSASLRAPHKHHVVRLGFCVCSPSRRMEGALGYQVQSEAETHAQVASA